MRQRYRVIATALFMSTLTLFGAGAVKPTRTASAETTNVPSPIATPDMCSASFPIMPLVTLPSGQTVRCPAQAAQPTASSSPQLPGPCVVPGVNDWCPAWIAQPYDGPGHKSDSPGNFASTRVMGTSADGKLVFVAGTSDQDPSSSSTNYQAVTIAYNTSVGNVVWTAPFIAPNGLQSYSQSLAVGGSRVFVVITASSQTQFASMIMAYDAATGAAVWPAVVRNVNSGRGR